MCALFCLAVNIPRPSQTISRLSVPNDNIPGRALVRVWIAGRWGSVCDDGFAVKAGIAFDTKNNVNVNGCVEALTKDNCRQATSEEACEYCNLWFDEHYYTLAGTPLVTY